jgi:hypothetical protein
MSRPPEPTVNRIAVAPGRSLAGIGARVAVTLVQAFPLTALAALFGDWVVAGRALGHLPRAALDDPNSIPLTAGLHGVTAALFHAVAFMAPAALLITFADMCTQTFRDAPDRAAFRLRGIVVVAIWIGATCVVFLDPLGVNAWWFD